MRDSDFIADFNWRLLFLVFGFSSRDFFLWLGFLRSVLVELDANWDVYLSCLDLLASCFRLRVTWLLFGALPRLLLHLAVCLIVIVHIKVAVNQIVVEELILALQNGLKRVIVVDIGLGQGCKNLPKWHTPLLEFLEKLLGVTARLR